MASIVQRTAEDGSPTYRVRVRLKGSRLQTATFRRLTDAKKWAQHTEAAIREGRHFKTAEAKRHTLGELIDRYIETVLPGKPKSGPKQQQQLEWWKDQLGHYVLSDVTPAIIGEYRDKLGQGKTARGGRRSPATVVRYLAALSHAFSVAVKEWGWLDDTPLRKVQKPREPRGRVRYLSEDERPKLLAACRQASDHLYAAVVLALSTGMRRGELLGIAWADVDFGRGRLILHETKNGERRNIPLAGHALQTLTEMAANRQKDSHLVFPGLDPRRPIDIRTSWENAVTAAGIDDFRFHDLRHSAASYLAMSGASIAEIAEVLGHKTLQMVKRYSHLSEAHTSRVVERMNSSIFPEA